MRKRLEELTQHTRTSTKGMKQWELMEGEEEEEGEGEVEGEVEVEEVEGEFREEALFLIGASVELCYCHVEYINLVTCTDKRDSSQ